MVWNTMNKHRLWNFYFSIHSHSYCYSHNTIKAPIELMTKVLSEWSQRLWLSIIHSTRNKYCRGQYFEEDRLCGLVVRVLGYRSGGPGSIPGITRFFWGGGGRKTVVCLERGPLSLVSTTEELLDRKVAAPV
jgi:hypothetical protein